MTLAFDADSQNVPYLLDRVLVEWPLALVHHVGNPIHHDLDGSTVDATPITTECITDLSDKIGNGDGIGQWGSLRYGFNYQQAQ